MITLVTVVGLWSLDGAPLTPEVDDARDIAEGLRAAARVPSAVVAAGGEILVAADDRLEWHPAAAAVARLAPFFEAAAETSEVRCRGGWCAIGDRQGGWLARLRRIAPAGYRLAGVLRVDGPAPGAAEVLGFVREVEQPFFHRTAARLGTALSLEEQGKMTQAIATLERAWLDDPESPWPLYYRCRMLVEVGKYREAYLDFRRLLVDPSPVALAAVLRVPVDEEMKRFREHTAVAPFLEELLAPAPPDLQGYLEHLRRFRRAPSRLEAELAEAESVDVVALGDLLEAFLLFDPRLETNPPRIVWGEASVELARGEGRSLRIGGLVLP